MLVLLSRNGLTFTCRCDCGAVKNFSAANVTSGSARSCGCARPKYVSDAKRKHGRAGTPLYRTWTGMKGRCMNPNSHKYPLYGGRGIAVCDRWMNSFEAFLSDMGEKPTPAHSLDRINNDGNYEPGNCRWATAKQQVMNRRKLPRGAAPGVVGHTGHTAAPVAPVK